MRNEQIMAAVLAGEPLSSVARRFGISRQRVDQISKPDRLRARRMTTAALKSGTLVRAKKCASCGQRRRTQAHHADYTKPLDVQWLCSRCHRIEDMKPLRGIISRRQRERRVARREAAAKAAAIKKEQRKGTWRRLYRWRWRHCLRLLREFVGTYGRSPAYWELAEIVLGRTVTRNQALTLLSQFMGRNWLRCRDWRVLHQYDRVRALYRLAGFAPRPVGRPGHIRKAA